MVRKSTMILLALALSLTALLAACSGNNGNTQESTPGSTATPAGTAAATKKPQEPVTLKVWYRLGGYYRDMLTETIKAFNKENPLITIEVNDVPPAQYGASMQSAIAADQMPDIFMNGLTLEKLIEMDIPRDLSDMFPASRQAEFLPGTFAPGGLMQQGKVWGVPTRDPRPHVPLVFYNKKMVEKAGYTEADLSKQLSQEQFIELVKKTQEANSLKYGIAFSGRSDLWWFHANFLYYMSTAVDPEVQYAFNLHTGEQVYNNPGLVDAMKFVKNLDAEKFFLPNWLTMTNPEVRQVFVDGKDLAFTFQLLENAGSLPQDDNIGVMAIPTKDGKPSYVPFSGTADSYFLVSKKSEHQAEAIQFLEFFMTDTFTRGLQQAKMRSPLKALNESVKNDSALFGKVTKVIDPIYKVVPNPNGMKPNNPGVYSEFYANKPTVAVSDVFYGYLTDQIKDLQGALDDVNEEYNKIWDNAIETVNKKTPVSKEDFKFPTWTPFEDFQVK